MNRVKNTILPATSKWVEPIGVPTALRAIANALGEEYLSFYRINSYMQDNFHRCLRVIEVLYEYAKYGDNRLLFEDIVKSTIQQSEIDLGIKWENGVFIRSGAALLDQKLVNESLRWLSEPKYKNVYTPFAKGLSHFLKSEKQPELLSDVITDMYESLEALSKIVTGKPNKDLSANAELFIKKVKASKAYKKMLKDYIDYANEFRHAVEEGRKKPTLSVNEVESFVYLTGVFIRLAMGSA